jgi:hypothetical protein
MTEIAKVIGLGCAEADEINGLLESYTAELSIGH